jgi:GGDEF domain-containing protein
VKLPRPSMVPADNPTPPAAALAAGIPQRGWCVGAREDPLTGLLAFPDFHRTLPAFLVSSLEAGKLVALAIGDVDGLKDHVESTNSTDPASYGHLAGNAVMTTLGATTRQWFDEQPWAAGCVATFGGDEVIVAVCEDDPSRFLDAVQNLRDRLCLALPVTVSFAVTIVSPDHLPSPSERPGWRDLFTDRLFAAVDRCLFIHKAARRKAQMPGGIVAVTEPGIGTGHSAAGLFPLPTGRGRALHATATLTKLPAGKILLLPCRGPNGMRGRRIRVAVGYAQASTEIVISANGQAAIAAPADSVEGPVPIILSALHEDAHHRVPADLQSALRERGLFWSALPRPEQDQLLHLIRESSDSAIRSDRIEATLLSVAARTRTAK